MSEIEYDDDESTVSFELYEDGYYRDKIIREIKEEGEEFEVGSFLLKYYKYRELGDLSKGFGSLIEGINEELIESVNENYLNFIKLGKSIDGSLDLIHDNKIDIGEYLKNLKLSNENIDKSTTNINKLNNYRFELNEMKVFISRLIKLNKMIEWFDKLCLQFDANERSGDMILELVGVYLGINKMMDSIKFIEENIIFDNMVKKMNALRVEFKSLLKNYLDKFRDLDNDEVFQVFKMYQLVKDI